MNTSVFPDGASADAERCVVLAHARLSELYVQLLEHRRSLHCHVTDAFFTLPAPNAAHRHHAHAPQVGADWLSSEKILTFPVD
jgi:hypothetical protein